MTEGTDLCFIAHNRGVLPVNQFKVVKKLSVKALEGLLSTIIFQDELAQFVVFFSQAPVKKASSPELEGM